MADKKLIKQLIELNNQYYKDFVIDYEDGILREHNIKVYEKIIKGFIRGNKVLFEQATGTGKTYLALKFLHDHAKGKRVLFVSPTNAIQNSFIETYKKLLGEDFDCELDTCLYQGIKGKQKKQYDIIIFDEVHRMGAKTWGPNAETLMNNNPSASILGMTATLERPDGVDVTKFFDGKKPVSRITLVQALERGILPKPNYTLAKVDFTDDSKFIDTCIKDFREKLKTAEDEEKEEILEFLNRLKKAKQAISESEDIPAIFAHELRTDELKQGKFIVFCPSGEDDEETAESITKMKAIMKQATKWFAGIEGVKKIKKYSVYSKLDAKKNKKIIEAFEDDDSKALKLLFSINMLNEGLHVDDIDGVIMLRSTGSRIIYLQQLGRALSVGHKHQPKIFDFVANLNYVDVESIQQMVTDVNASKNGCGNKYGNDGNTPTSTDFEDLQFKLTIDNLETLQLIDALKQNIFDYNHRNDFVFEDFYARLMTYYNEFRDCLVKTEYRCKDDNYPLGIKVSMIRAGAINLSEDEKTTLTKLGFVWKVMGRENDNIRISIKNFVENWKRFIAEHDGRTPKTSGDKEEKFIYDAWRRYANPQNLNQQERDYLINNGIELREIVEIADNIRPAIKKFVEELKLFLAEHDGKLPRQRGGTPAERSLHNRLRMYTDPKNLEIEEQQYVIDNGIELKEVVEETDDIRLAIKQFVIECNDFVSKNKRLPKYSATIEGEFAIYKKWIIYTNPQNLNPNEQQYVIDNGIEMREIIEVTDNIRPAIKNFVEDYNKFLNQYCRPPRQKGPEKGENALSARHFKYTQAKNLNADEIPFMKEKGFQIKEEYTDAVSIATISSLTQ